jgi:hypothetical protein
MRGRLRLQMLLEVSDQGILSVMGCRVTGNASAQVVGTLGKNQRVVRFRSLYKGV